jgi:hypothetical protein
VIAIGHIDPQMTQISADLDLIGLSYERHCELGTGCRPTCTE